MQGWWLQGKTIGPLGYPMTEEAASLLEAELAGKTADYHRRRVDHKAETIDSERTDVSWITSETVDHDKEILRASGMDDKIFAKNPIVTLNHSYYMPPVGECLWRVRLTENGQTGVKAATRYPKRPKDWAEQDAWVPDTVWSLVKAGLVRGKSIGFLTKKAHAPTEEEIQKNPSLVGVRRIVDEWVLLEYCVCWTPANPDAVVEAVGKAGLDEVSLKALGVEPPSRGKEKKATVTTFATPAEVLKEANRIVGGTDWDAMLRSWVRDGIDLARGKV